MTILDAVLLGLVQGLTEFLPVSSSGHLVLAHHFLGLSSGDATFDILLHLGTAASVIVVMRRELLGLLPALPLLLRPRSFGGAWRDSAPFRTLCLLALASLPAAVLGLALEETIDRAFGSPRLAALLLLVTAAILLVASRARDRGRPLGVRSALAMGLGQAVALLPGISRSGTTLSTGLLAGVERRTAVNFAFLMALPVILGAGLLRILTGDGVASLSPAPMLLGVVTAFASGIVALRVLVRVVIRGRLWWFAVWCAAVSVVSLAGVGLS